MASNRQTVNLMCCFYLLTLLSVHTFASKTSTQCNPRVDLIFIYIDLQFSKQAQDDISQSKGPIYTYGLRGTTRRGKSFVASGVARYLGHQSGNS